MTFIVSGSNPNKGLTNYHAQFKVVALNPLTMSYLHLSGTSETRDRNYAWAGTKTQFAKLQKAMSITVDYKLISAQENASNV